MCIKCEELMREVEEQMSEGLDKIRKALEYFGESGKDPEDCDICDDGSVYLGLTQILPPGSIEVES